MRHSREDSSRVAEPESDDARPEETLEETPEDERVSEASIESFPASDPPAWTDGSAPSDPPRVLDLNEADAAQLVRAFGIGMETAERIVRHRDEELDGRFRDTRELQDVRGVDAELADRIGRRVSI